MVCLFLAESIDSSVLLPGVEKIFLSPVAPFEFAVAVDSVLEMLQNTYDTDSRSVHKPNM